MGSGHSPLELKFGGKAAIIKTQSTGGATSKHGKAMRPHHSQPLG